MNWNSAPSPSSRATLADSMSTASVIGPPSDSTISAPVSVSVTTRPSARVNIDRCERSHRAKASFIAFARSLRVCDGPTAKTRPGHGHSSSPRPPSSSTVTDNRVRAIVRGWHAGGGAAWSQPQT